jgi:hypothetical protein
MDFVTIVYNDAIELNLLKLQALSFSYVDASLVNNIYIMYNDSGILNRDDIVTYYPEDFRDKVSIVYLTDVCATASETKSSWYSQQVMKLLIANLVKSNYYLVLDGKNHFIRNITRSEYFDNDDKPRLFVYNPGKMLQLYYNCLEYYKIKCPFNYKDGINNKLLTTTPYLMNKYDVLEMMQYIEHKEKESLIHFFMKNNTKYCEFYLYSTYLILTDKIKHYCLTEKNFRSIMAAPLIAWNSSEVASNDVFNNNLIKIFGMHRRAIPLMDDNDKQTLLTMYKTVYNDAVVSFIKTYLLR